MFGNWQCCHYILLMREEFLDKEDRTDNYKRQFTIFILQILQIILKIEKNRF